jgi:hypothetical protein
MPINPCVRRTAVQGQDVIHRLTVSVRPPAEFRRASFGGIPFAPAKTQSRFRLTVVASDRTPWKLKMSEISDERWTRVKGRLRAEVGEAFTAAGLRAWSSSIEADTARISVPTDF